MRRLLAYMWMASKTSCIPKPKSGSDTTITAGWDPEFEAIIVDQKPDAGVATGSGVSNATQRTSVSTNPAVSVPNTGDPNVTEPLTITVTTTQDLPGAGFRVNAKSTRWKITETTSCDSGSGKTYTYICYKPAVIRLTSCHVRRWQLAREAMDKYYLKKPDTNLDFVTIKSIMVVCMPWHGMHSSQHTESGNYGVFQRLSLRVRLHYAFS